LLVGKFVNVYLRERLYGGPEEGGWWFDAGTPLLRLETYGMVDQEALEVLVDTLQENFSRELRRVVSESGYCVLSESERDYLVLLEDEPGQSWPDVYPVYE